MRLKSDDGGGCTWYQNLAAGWKGGQSEALCDALTTALNMGFDKFDKALNAELKTMNAEICTPVGAFVEETAQPLIAALGSIPIIGEIVGAALEATLLAVDAAVVRKCTELLTNIEKEIENITRNVFVDGIKPGSQAAMQTFVRIHFHHRM